MAEGLLTDHKATFPEFQCSSAMPHNRSFTDGAELNILIERTQSRTNVIL